MLLYSFSMFKEAKMKYKEQEFTLELKREHSMYGEGNRANIT